MGKSAYVRVIQLKFVKLVKRPEASSISLVHYLANFFLQADCSFYSGHLQKIDVDSTLVEKEVKKGDTAK